MTIKQIVDWLLDGDVSIQYQVHRDLLDQERADLQQRIATEGFGAKFLLKRNDDGHWGREFYQPKWTSSHYTLLDLRNICITPENLPIKKTIDTILNTSKAQDGGISLLKSKKSDVCVNGMFLNYATYFMAEEHKLKSVIDCLLKEIMPDGGFNCRSNRSRAKHSSMHSTLSVLEGFTEYKSNKYSYRLDEINKAISSAKEFLLLHQLYISDKTSEVIDKRFLQLSYPILGVGVMTF